MGSTRVELFEAIRRDARREELSVRALADRHGVHRRTVRAALASATPPPRKPRRSPAPKLNPAKPFIDAMLRGDLTAPRKQRHTARRVLARLVDEHQLGELTYSSVRDYVARRRPQIAAEAGRCMEKAFVLQTHDPGAEAEVDFGDVWVNLAGELTKCALFAFRLSFSGKAVHRHVDRTTGASCTFRAGDRVRVRSGVKIAPERRCCGSGLGVEPAGRVRAGRGPGRPSGVHR